MFKIKYFLFSLLIAALFISCKSQADKDYDEVSKLIDSDRCTDAIELATKFIEKNPNDARFYYHRGYCYLRTNLYKAKEDFSNCIKIDSKYSNGYYGLSMVYSREGQFDLADKNINKAIEFAPNNERKATYLSGSSFDYARQKNFKKAIEVIKKAIELNDEGSYYNKLGIFYNADGQKKEAETTWLKAINEKQFKQIEFKHGTYANLAQYYFEEKDYKKSKDYIEKAIELAPNNDRYVRFYNEVKGYMK